MHPMFIELFIETDADDLAEQDRRRRVRRSPASPAGHGYPPHRTVMTGPRYWSEIRPSDRKEATCQPPASPFRHCGNLLPAVADAVETTLSWNEDTGAVTVSVWDRASGGHLQFTAAPDKALHAFYHPYAYAATVGAA